VTPGVASILRMTLFGAGLLFFLWLELKRPYRPETVPKARRWFVNLGLTAVNTLVLALVLGGLPLFTALYVQEHQIGVLNLVRMPYWLKVLAGVAFMDFMLYVWHLLNHEMPLLWRFHRVHHTDLNMDVSTATRFHLGELLISAFIKVGLIYFLGADVLTVVIFESALVLCAQFQHSSLRISPAWEAPIWPLLVPPSMHRIHHSVKIRERNSNYGTIFSIWDRILGTLVKEVDQDGIVIGVGGHFDPARLGLPHLFIMPFTRRVP